ncbi:probable apyrase 5 isoform X6 [Coffea arabica]|uniref:Probable apyrase 5 isoform X6 n=1 Tax=Coffea arabica TaxID=13443 RepID=A0ABM4X8I0_COFAR
MATAGLRMLEKGVQDRILEACRTVLRGSDFRFYDDWASVISGGDPKQTTGIIELGGAAAQANDRELQFSIVDGDFKKFEGKWSVKSGKSTMLLNALEEMKKVGFWICS